ncbi:hypothetical protein C358_02297 [Cryptococcus neoformans MW-RSA852]|nr:hypothetical protein C358_02297 [Cryptococcus neoformans var. grubii MW-RSA852]
MRMGGRRTDNTASSGIMLIPTLGKDPNDPLNWSKGRKYLMLACVSLILYRPSSHLYSVFDSPSASTGLCLDQLNVGTRPV